MSQSADKVKTIQHLEQLAFLACVIDPCSNCIYPKSSSNTLYHESFQYNIKEIFVAAFNVKHINTCKRLPCNTTLFNHCGNAKCVNPFHLCSILVPTGFKLVLGQLPKDF